MARYDIKKAQLSVEELQSRHAFDKAASIDWQPVYARIKIQPDEETLSGRIITLQKETFVRGTIISVGPGVGFRDAKKEHDFYPGRRVIYNKSHELKYTGADGVEHVFLKDDEESIVAVEPNSEIQ
jgi:co-chaperonin GroES (HSP10)